ncbi:MAG: NAD(P)/FAD-dependent oxidoreductase [Actinomycetales bacterium]|nr:NAD(P)/FAD-dependent oxidoreductase [Actinomycetales bacterium]
MSPAQDYVIVGGGVAAVRAAEALREHGAQGSVRIISAEPHLPYVRPPLSKEYLQDQVPRDSVFVHDEAWYRDHDIEVAVGTRAVAVHPAARSIDLIDGQALAYDRLLIATGSSARVLGIPGEDLDGVHRLRTLDDCDRLRDVLRTGQRLVIVGGGWIGLEVAAAARIAGMDVTLLEQDTQPLRRVLGSELGELFADLHVQHGVRLLTQVSVRAIVGSSGHVAGVELDDGTTIRCDAVLVGVGASPNLDVVRDSELAVNTGIVVDEFLRTSDPAVFAAGDVAEAFHPRYSRHIRVEHIDNAEHQGSVAGQNMLGIRNAYERLPFFYSDQYDVGLEYTGFAPPGGYDRVVVRGNTEDFSFIAFWLADHRVVAAMNVNTWDVRPQLLALIGSGLDVDEGRLADPTADIPEPATR